jgi:alkylation response protein AidB-like acyl-CoA dehydrogenase
MTLIRLNSEQKMIENEVKKFAKTELEPIASEIDKNGVFPIDIVEKLAGLGLSSLIIPEKYNGAGLDTVSLCIAVEELAAVCASVSLIFAVNNGLVAYPIIKYGSEEIKGKYLKRLIDGDIGGFGIETGIEMNKSGQTEDRADGSFEFVLNGEQANFIIFARHKEGDKNLYIHECVQEDTLLKRRMLGMRAAGIVRLEAQHDHKVEGEVLGHLSDPMQALNDLQHYSDIIFSALSLGIAHSAYETSLAYSKERHQFGRAICDFPMVQEKLVDMKVKMSAARLLVYDAAARVDAGQDYSIDASMARLFTSSIAVQGGLDAIQIHGGYGYTKEYPVERQLRDAKTVQLLSTGSEDLKTACAKELLS